MEQNIWIVIPVYNHCRTIAAVVSACLAIHPKVLVVDDGSTDIDVAAVLSNFDIKVISHQFNSGKGQALLTALEFLKSVKADFMITIDADGQHYPEDILKFLPIVASNDSAIVVGCRDFDNNVPKSSRLGRMFANFWFKLETGADCGDCQSGFRAYPLKYINQLKLISRHYNFETEVLTRGVWAGLSIINLPVRSYYPPAGERISHFKPLLDNWRISLIHFHLVALRLLPFNYRKLVKAKSSQFSIFEPMQLLRSLIDENSSPLGLAVAAAVGTFLAVIPIPGFHTAAILYVAIRWNLNKIMAVLIQNLFMPPFTPFLCIEIGYYLKHGVFLQDFTVTPWLWEAPARFQDWLIGSLVLAPLFAVISGVIIYLISWKIANVKAK